MKKKALITGITGQDGSYLAEFLLSKNYEVHGIVRRSSTFNTQRIDGIYVDPQEVERSLVLHYGDLSDPGVIMDVIWNIRPDEIYNLGAQSHVKVSFDMPEFTGNITGLGTTRILEAIRRSKIQTKFYQASSSEMFGAASAPQSEETKFYPRSPYAAAKVYSYWMTVNYRESYDLFACNGILFNHESPRRGPTFVTRKITRAVAAILAGKQDCLYLGNLYARRDWGFAPEYVEMMWLMLQQDNPQDYVVGTGESHTVKDFVQEAFRYVGIELSWFGENESEVGIASYVEPQWLAVIPKGMPLVKIDPRYYRPTEVDELQADISKAKQLLKWQPRVTFDELVKIMMDYDLLAAGVDPIGAGMRVCKEKDFAYTSHGAV
ncbi:GDP-mannose 4,6-dehydratase [Candidatus Dependentiae bacterium]|nr:GDP-mannose 4,6-dehydratase [Candidatus Dependentiae bacterium]